MENVLPLNDYEHKKTKMAINRIHAFIHGAALATLIYYRITSIGTIYKSNTPILPHLLIFMAEVTLSFQWLLSQGSKWGPVARTTFPERLPEDDSLPSVDVFVCTADPNKEPSLGVMNTVISAMALDYPPDKLHVYVSDDGGSPVTLSALREAWGFAMLWIPFCRKYEVVNRCPDAYFFEEDQQVCSGDDHFFLDKKEIQNAYEDFKISLAKNIAAGTKNCNSSDHPSIIEVMKDANENKSDLEKDRNMPLVAYVAREKRPSNAHHFKAGALNVLLRVSAIISNSPYILVLDCDMYCNDPKSARQAMCFHLDPQLSPNLGFVQFPQKFHNLPDKDIYDGEIRYAWEKWEGLNGVKGPLLSGTGFYIKRAALYGTQELRKNVDDTVQLAKCFGSSKEFVKSIYKPNYTMKNGLPKELQLLASCSYDDVTEWGEQVGFRYFSVVEDVFTGFHLHCEGWNSVYYEPSRPCFLGASPASLGEALVQQMRWGLGLIQIGFSKFCPLFYGLLRIPILQTMCYAEVTFYPLYFLPLHVHAILPQICLLRGIHIYPQVSSPFFLVFVFVFLSSQAKHVQEVLIMGHPIRTWFTEQRMWMIKSLTSYLYANLNSLLDKIGLVTATFLPTNKAVDEDAAKLHQMGMYNYNAPPLLMAPLCTLYIINLASFLIGFARILRGEEGINGMLIETFIPLFGMILHYPLLEGMVFRKDKGRVPTNVCLLSLVISSLVLAYTSFGS